MAEKKNFSALLVYRKRGSVVVVRWTLCNPPPAHAPRPLQSAKQLSRIHRRSSFAGIVFRSMNCAIASAGIRTARPQLTRGSFLRSSQARIVAGLSASSSLASLTESNLGISFAPEVDGLDTPYPAKFPQQRRQFGASSLQVIDFLMRNFFEDFSGLPATFRRSIGNELCIERLPATELETCLIHVAVKGYWVTLNLEVSP
jgi:hypothetical protein